MFFMSGVAMNWESFTSAIGRNCFCYNCKFTGRLNSSKSDCYNLILAQVSNVAGTKSAEVLVKEYSLQKPVLAAVKDTKVPSWQGGKFEHLPLHLPLGPQYSNSSISLDTVTHPSALVATT